jgi:hypothetical protein
MNFQHRTLNIERRIMYSAIINKGKAKRLPYSTLSVGRSMFNLLHLEFRHILHNMLKSHIQVRSSEIGKKYYLPVLLFLSNKMKKIKYP